MNFVESTDCPQSPPPFFFPGVTLRICQLTTSLAHLQDWCDKFLNIGTRHHFRAVAPFAFLCVNHYPKMILADFRGLGFATQNEYFFMFPVLRHDALGTFLLPTELTWAIPFIGVDNPNSALAGQLVLGFPKLSGRLDLATATTGAFSARIAMPGMATLAPTSQETLLPIIDLETGPPILDQGTAPLPFPWGLVATGIDLVDDALLLLLEAIDPGLFSATNLKQVRDGADPTAAAYQALVRAEWRQANTSDTIVFDGARVTVFDNAVVRIAATLGLADPVTVTGADGRVGARFEATRAFGLTTDLSFGDVTNLSLGAPAAGALLGPH